MKEQHRLKFSQLYNEYLYVIKPLIAEIEALYEQFPIGILNEIRAFNDHVARCFIENTSDDEIERQLNKAKSHNERILLDCYKYLNVWYHDTTNNFEKEFKNIDLTIIDNGEFFNTYNTIKKEAIDLTRYAKMNENKLDEISFNNYQNSYNKWSELYSFYHDNIQKLNWAKTRIKKSKVRTKVIAAILWILSLIITIFVGSILTNNNQAIVDAFKQKMNIQQNNINSNNAISENVQKNSE